MVIVVTVVNDLILTRWQGGAVYKSLVEALHVKPIATMAAPDSSTRNN